MNEIVLIADPTVSRIPVQDCGEPLVDLGRHPLIRVDHRYADPDGAWRHLRAGVAERLDAAARELPDGVHLMLVDGYRPPPRQLEYYLAYSAQLAEAHPELSEAELRRLASRFVAPPELAPHSAGAAIDVTLCHTDGSELPMGTPVDATPEQSAGCCYTDAPGIDGRARANRQLLGSVLRAAGLVNYPTEWWHWSFGDRYWALAEGSPHAHYGPVAPGPVALG